MGDSEKPDADKQTPRVKLPEENVPAEAIRAVLEATAQLMPPVAFVATLLNFINPSEKERLLAEWRAEVTSAVNDHDAAIRRLEAKVTPRFKVSKLAVAVAYWLVKSSEDALRDLVMFDDLVAEFPGFSKPELEEACFELKHFNLVTCTATMGYPVRAVRPHYDLFWIFDPIVHKTDPQADAVELAKHMLADSELETVQRLHDKVRWPKRQLNPAVAYLMQFVDDRRTRKVIQHDYPTIGFVLNSEDRFQLRRFVQEFEG
jgi:hypothetical protein